jgi:hypothetical protein
MGRSRDDRACGQRPILSRAVLGALIGFSLAFNVMLLAAPGYMLQVYDRVLPSRATETLVLLTVLAAGVLIAAGLLDLVRSRLLVRIGNAVTERGPATRSTTCARCARSSTGARRPRCSTCRGYPPSSRWCSSSTRGSAPPRALARSSWSGSPPSAS